MRQISEELAGLVKLMVRVMERDGAYEIVANIKLKGESYTVTVVRE